MHLINSPLTWPGPHLGTSHFISILQAPPAPTQKIRMLKLFQSGGEGAPGGGGAADVNKLQTSKAQVKEALSQTSTQHLTALMVLYPWCPTFLMLVLTLS